MKVPVYMCLSAVQTLCFCFKLVLNDSAAHHRFVRHTLDLNPTCIVSKDHVFLCFQCNEPLQRSGQESLLRGKVFTA